MRAFTSMKYSLPSLVHQELHGSRIDVFRCGDRRPQFLGERSPELVADRRRGRFFEQLLVPPLDAAIALAQNLHTAVLVGENLEFDMTR